MAESHGRHSSPPIHSVDPHHHKHSVGASSSRRCHRDTAGRLAGFPDLLVPSLPQRKYHGVWQQAWGMWVAEITDRYTHKKLWLGLFHTAELAACEYNLWLVRLHGVDDRLNFVWGEMSLLDPLLPRVVNAAVAWAGGRRRGVHGRLPPKVL
nr:ethylene-responsive transcription factor RAP2-4-like [Aegilops tauschii subsp. strangulata]